MIKILPVHYGLIKLYQVDADVEGQTTARCLFFAQNPFQMNLQFTVDDNALEFQLEFAKFPQIRAESNGYKMIYPKLIDSAGGFILAGVMTDAVGKDWFTIATFDGAPDPNFPCYPYDDYLIKPVLELFKIENI